MKSKLILGLLSLFMVFSMTSCMEKVDAGCEGIKVAEAQAKKLIVAAEAEKKANELRQQALTPAILEKMWIEKWDGTVPTVITGGNTSAFLDLSKIRK